PLRADAHQQVRREDGQEQRLQPDPREPDRVALALPAEDDERGDGEQRADEQARAEHVQRQRQVDVVVADGGDDGHAPGFQIMRTRITKITTEVIAWKRIPAGRPATGSLSNARPARPPVHPATAHRIREARIQPSHSWYAS